MRDSRLKFKVVLNLKGGLGNQLFQAAALDAFLSRYRHYKKEDFIISTLNIPRIHDQVGILGLRLPFIFEPYKRPLKSYRVEPIRYFTHSATARVLNMLSNHVDFLELLNNAHRDDFFKEYSDGYYENSIFPKNSNYFSRRVLPDLTLQSNYFTAITEFLKDKDFTLLHARRGDFVDEKRALPFQYFDSAIDHILRIERSASHRIYWISDSPNWFRHKFSTLNSKYTYEKISYLKSSENLIASEILHLSALASKLILSNSTLSWWMSWFNPKKESLVPFTELSPLSIKKSLLLKEHTIIKY